MMNIPTALGHALLHKVHVCLRSGLLVAVVGGGVAGAAQAAEIASVSRITFGPSDTLFVADWVQSKVHALKLPKGVGDAGKPFNLMDLDTALSQALGTNEVKINDIAVRPGTDEVYVAVTAGANGAAAILRVMADGSAQKLNLAKMPSSDASLEDAPRHRSNSGTETAVAATPSRT